MYTLCAADHRVATHPHKGHSCFHCLPHRHTNDRVDYRTGVVLPLGDYLWVAEHCTDRAREKLVIDIVVERKREDDLARSIMDKSNRCVCASVVDRTCRYADQKTRLIESGIRQRVLLVEKVNALTTHVPADARVLRQACAGSQVYRNAV